MGFFQTYRSTEGLDRFPRDKQFCVWRAAHKRLKASDPSYRVGCRRFLAKYLVVTLTYCLYCNYWLVLPRHVSENFSVVLNLGAVTATVAFLPWCIIVSFRQQRWLNARVADGIRNVPTGAS